MSSTSNIGVNLDDPQIWTLVRTLHGTSLPRDTTDVGVVLGTPTDTLPRLFAAHKDTVVK